MEYTFSDRVSSLKPSAIREILKLSSQPGMIPFSAGNPAPEAFPVDDIREITAKIMSDEPVFALQYSVTEGYAPLKDTVMDYVNSHHNINTSENGIIITAGAQQAMDLTTKSLCNEGDTIICEAPTFIGTLNSFRSYNTNLCGIPMESDGINIEKLETALKTEKNVRFIYVIPNFQNPSGITMSLEKRKAVYALAKQYGVMILEDDPYGELRFDGEYIPPIKSLDTQGIVIYVGSFSKVLSPGLRVGYAIAPEQILSKLTVCKQVSDVHTSILAQMIAYNFMKNCDFLGHIEKIRNIYKSKAELMMTLCDKHFDGKISYHKVQGGLFLWCDLPENANMLDFTQKALEKSVAVVPGNAFLVDETAPCNSIRLNYSTPTDEQIIKGIETLGELAKSL